MSDIQKAILYFEDAVRESNEIIEDLQCSEALKEELREQKGHFAIALEALREQEVESNREHLKVAEWISVKERPPIDETKDYQEKWEEDPEFLVMIKDGVVPTCLYFDGVNWYANGGESFTYNVTHWMPLPELPKGNRPG